jgi:hypothetical protein
MPRALLDPDHVFVEEQEEQDDDSYEEFDRLAFTMSALDLVRPKGMTVAVCRGVSRLRVEAGRAWGRGPDASWALVSIPPNASRRAIAVALTKLTKAGATPPYALDVLFSGRPAGE